MSADKRTPEGRLLRSATGVMESALQQGPKNHAELEVRASQDGAILGHATWTRTDGWAFEGDVLVNLKKRGGGYASLRVTKSW